MAKIKDEKADNERKWTIRGVPKSAQRLAGDLARREELAVGRWLARLIEQAAASTGPAAQAVLPDGLQAVVTRIEALEADVSTLKSRLAVFDAAAGTASPEQPAASSDLPVEAPVPAAAEAFAPAGDGPVPPASARSPRSRRTAGDSAVE